MPRTIVAVVLLTPFLASCGHSGKHPTAVAPPADPGLIVSANPADHPDFLCDGVEDDVEINAAIQTVDSAAHFTVILRPGTYSVLHGVHVVSNITLRGGGTNTVIRLADNAPSMVNVSGIVRAKDDAQNGVARRVHDVTLEDFVVDGNRSHQAPTADEKKFGFYGEGDFLTFRRLVARNCAGYGFDPHGHADSVASTNVLIEDCEAYGNLLDGFALDRMQNSTIRRNYAHDNDRHGFNLVSETTGLGLTNCRAVHNGATGLMAQNGAHEVTVQACEMTGNGLQGIYLRDADGCRLLGNTLHDNVRSGLLLRLADHTTVSDNNFS